MLVLENTIFTFNQFPQNNIGGEYNDNFNSTLMDDYTQDNQNYQNQYIFTPDKIDYDNYCPSPGIIDTSNENNEGNSPVRRHRFSICKANDPQAIIAYRRLSNACSSNVPSPGMNIGQSYQSSPYIAPPLLFDDNKKDERKISNENLKNAENNFSFNSSTSCPNIISNQRDESYVLSPVSKKTSISYNQKETQSPFNTILTPNTFGPIMTPYQVIDNVSYNDERDLDEQFRLFNYIEEDENDFENESLPSALNSNSQINDNSNCDIALLNTRIRLNSNNNIKNSEIITSNPTINDIKKTNDQDYEYEDNDKTPMDKICHRSKIEFKIELVEKANIDDEIKEYSQNIQGLYGLWKNSFGIGFGTILRE
ncbi:hypothetical protein BCR36DRAFT_585841 [Piromyces finnis]|uniref:Uncharacterized protein n=1 Tax=Piromyces finnis TaxID=1754191 RepID=A0A1Y1V1Z9_9FUNG|nr:hypothetical protein BCR36DRAFT_585841 [Piromyces finnis]|eukprot:ORX45234.1 hypothetical protein BCR36DRAFT_585841 [Piromyces finnis]